MHFCVFVLVVLEKELRSLVREKHLEDQENEDENADHADMVEVCLDCIPNFLLALVVVHIRTVVRVGCVNLLAYRVPLIVDLFVNVRHDPRGQASDDGDNKQEN